jgi:hypothetical protein
MTAAGAPDLDGRPIRFRIRFTVAEAAADGFVGMLEGEYIPALRSQPGFRTARILTPFPKAVSDEIGAVTQPGMYELEFDFDSESARRDWVAQPIHDRLWQQAAELSDAQQWSGFYAAGED